MKEPQLPNSFLFSQITLWTKFAWFLLHFWNTPCSRFTLHLVVHEHIKLAQHSSSNITTSSEEWQKMAGTEFDGVTQLQVSHSAFITLLTPDWFSCHRIFCARIMKTVNNLLTSYHRFLVYQMLVQRGLPCTVLCTEYSCKSLKSNCLVSENRLIHFTSTPIGKIAVIYEHFGFWTTFIQKLITFENWGSTEIQFHLLHIQIH